MVLRRAPALTHIVQSQKIPGLVVVQELVAARLDRIALQQPARRDLQADAHLGLENDVVRDRGVFRHIHVQRDGLRVAGHVKLVPADRHAGHHHFRTLLQENPLGRCAADAVAAHFQTDAASVHEDSPAGVVNRVAGDVKIRRVRTAGLTAGRLFT